MAKTGDQIIYEVIQNPGGIDGLDPADKGGVKFASFSKTEAIKHLDAWSKVVPRIVNIEEETNKALKKLSPVEYLLLQAKWQEELVWEPVLKRAVQQ